MLVEEIDGASICHVTEMAESNLTKTQLVTHPPDIVYYLCSNPSHTNNGCIEVYILHFVFRFCVMTIIIVDFLSPL